MSRACVLSKPECVALVCVISVCVISKRVPCVWFCRQLSKEQQDLKVALDRQLALNQRLSQEKEQLVFKLRHRDSYPSIHLAAMVPEIAPR